MRSGIVILSQFDAAIDNLARLIEIRLLMVTTVLVGKGRVNLRHCVSGFLLPITLLP